MAKRKYTRKKKVSKTPMIKIPVALAKILVAKPEDLKVKYKGDHKQVLELGQSLLRVLLASR